MTLAARRRSPPAASDQRAGSPTGAADVGANEARPPEEGTGAARRPSRRGSRRYTLRASSRALSVRSQVKLGSVRPKWP
jgi:hypothetical protein